MRAHVESKRDSPVADVIDEWNRVRDLDFIVWALRLTNFTWTHEQRFFHPRCMDVVLAQGAITYTGPPNAPPRDMAERAAGKEDDEEHATAYDDTSDDEDSGPHMAPSRVGLVDSRGRQMHPAMSERKVRKQEKKERRTEEREIRREMKRERKRERKERKFGKNELSRDLKASAGERWRLIISYNPPVV